MNDKNKAKLKDKVLHLLNNENKTNPEVIASDLKKEVHLINYLCEELNQDGLVELREVTRKNTGPTRDYLLRTTNKGVYFLSLDGGFLKKYNRTIWTSRWTVVKVIAAIFNAIAILIIGFYSLYLSNKTNKLEHENEKLKLELKQKKQARAST